MPEKEAGSGKPDVNAENVLELSNDRLQQLMDLLASRDPASAPEYAGAIAAVLSSRLEGTPLTDDVRHTLGQLGTDPILSQEFEVGEEGL